MLVPGYLHNQQSKSLETFINVTVVGIMYMNVGINENTKNIGIYKKMV